MKNIFNKLAFIFTIGIVSTACHNDLDQTPIDPDVFSELDVYANANQAKSALAKLYAGYALTGQQGPAGNPDLNPNDIDEGFSQFTRTLFNLNELTTDHAVCGWGDPGLPDLHGMYWTASNDFSNAMYNRLGQEVSFCNSFIENAGQLSDEIVQTYIAEARFLRAYAYYNLMDLFGNVPIQTTVATTLPSQNTRLEVFEFVESELLEIQDLLLQSGQNEYGRVDQVAAWALLSRLYLNAEVWTGTPRYNDCITYSNLVMNSSYTIDMNDVNGNGTAYDELFLADNNSNGAQNEFIFAVNFDGIQTQTYGGSTFLVHAAIGGTMVPADYGVDSGWGGLRTTRSLVDKFETGEVDVDGLNSGLSGNLSDWGLVGDATPNGWDGPDVEMYETSTNQFSVYVNLTGGAIKFRFNEDWGVNYGDTGADGTLEPGGDNISVPAGIYLVTMNLDDLTYSLTEIEPSGDMRAMFYTDGQELEIQSIPPFKWGYAVTKFKNIDSNGNPGVGSGQDLRCDTDVPLIRLAEIYLNYAEATLRGGNGDMGIAVNKINELRTRAYGGPSGNITSSDLTLDFVLDERSRELYWELLRRTDLIRYNYFTTNNYLWPFKGNQPNGAAVSAFRNVFPIPSNTLATNPNLQQNTGY
ncbi:MAG: RagB/SusD family nutrient uptake outer membrane protein [Flavobacteriaceae bacterium]|nr:RagB/SusD family nutrient uptake outer membrane protein [Mangrovimonas sp.]MCB0431510.1 RagB/SusD family nutrient uptake outer membrane protein [Mangrovimonas sp.]MCB0435222.1 RagB/SusD family nutrient uptake outer membrane protein [Mangrovimonas sp.]MCB0437981.1 RagB/SusD family nutrient uptake outer membrane protein [Mangrovimonas sp.]MCB0469484.1 RagB/SusD family nutrient uptake outer membrane protein [Flavobacteriaceae bacterium]